MEDATVEIELEATDQSLVYEHSETSVTQDQDSTSLPSPESLSGFSAENNEDPYIHNPQDNIPARQVTSTTNLCFVFFLFTPLLSVICKIAKQKNVNLTYNM